MPNNKINLRRFFEIGGCCRIDYTCVLNGRQECCYPNNTFDFNLITNNGLAQINSMTFFFNGKCYEPLIDNDKGMFHYLILKN